LFNFDQGWYGKSIVLYAKASNTLDANSLDPFGDGSLKHFYKLDGDAKDSVGGIDGNIQGNVTWVDAKFGKGMYSENGGVYFTDNDLALNLQKYLSMWIRTPDSIATGNDVNVIVQVQQNDAGWTNYEVFLQNNKLKIGGRNGTHDNSSYTHIYESNLDIQTNTLYHIVISKKDNGEYDVYINNNLDGTFSFDFYVTSASHRQNIGFITNENDSPYSNNKFKVAIDHIQVFDRALTQDEVKQLYEAQ